MNGGEGSRSQGTGRYDDVNEGRGARIWKTL